MVARLVCVSWLGRLVGREGAGMRRGVGREDDWHGLFLSACMHAERKSPCWPDRYIKI